MTEEDGKPMSNERQKPLALVTGGASGMGRAIVERLARDGFAVMMVDRNEALAKQETAALRGQGLEVDFSAIDITNEGAPVRGEVVLDPGRVLAVRDA